MRRKRRKTLKPPHSCHVVQNRMQAVTECVRLQELHASRISIHAGAGTLSSSSHSRPSGFTNLITISGGSYCELSVGPLRANRLIGGGTQTKPATQNGLILPIHRKKAACARIVMTMLRQLAKVTGTRCVVLVRPFFPVFPKEDECDVVRHQQRWNPECRNPVGWTHVGLRPVDCGQSYSIEEV